MTPRPIKRPDASHPITIARNPNRVVVTAGGRTIADTTEALTLRESSYRPVHYIPRKHVDMVLLTRTAHATYCPYKGDCAYYSIATHPEEQRGTRCVSKDGERGVNAVWSYEQPFADVAAIKDHLAFYPDRVDSIAEYSVG